MKKYRRLSELLLFLVALVIYAITAAPSLMFTDSGELAAACASLNVAHPTGYPLFTILGHLWSLINPMQTEIAWLNILSGVFTAVSAVFFYKWLHIFLSDVAKEKSPKANPKSKQKQKTAQKSIAKENPTAEFNILLISVCSTLIYIFSFTVWQQAVALEVYSLQLLLMNLVLYFFMTGLTIGSKEEMRYFLLSALFIGLGFANHGTTILLLPAIILIFLTRDNAPELKKQLLQLLLLCIPILMGAALYLYLPIRSNMAPDINWGEVHRSLDKFLYHASGKQYRIMMFTGSEAFFKNAAIFFTSIPKELGYVGIISMLLGFFTLLKRSRRYFSLFLILLVSCMIYAFNYDIHDINAYFLLAYMMLIALSAYGMLWLIKKNTKIVFAFFVIPIISLIINFSDCDESDNYTVEAYTYMLLENIEENGIVISAEWDYWVSAFWYLQTVENVRPDIVLFEQELVRRTWFRNQMAHQYPAFFATIENEYDSFLEQLELFESGKKYNNIAIQTRYEHLFNQLIEKNIDSRPIYMTLDVLQTERNIAANMAKTPVGMAIKLDRKPILILSKDTKKYEDLFFSSIKGRTGHLYEGIEQRYRGNIEILKNYEKQMMKNPIENK